MNRVFQPGIDKPTQELTDQILKDITQKPENNTLVDNYRQMKQEMAKAIAAQALGEFVDMMKEREEYKEWLALNLKKDEKRRKKKVPQDDAKRVAAFINQIIRLIHVRHSLSIPDEAFCLL